MIGKRPDKSPERIREDRVPSSYSSARRTAQPSGRNMRHNPYAPPEAVAEPAPAPAPAPLPMQLYEEPIRGGWLTFLLVMKFIGNFIAAISNLLVISGVLSLQGRGPLVA